MIFNFKNAAQAAALSLVLVTTAVIPANAQGRGHGGGGQGRGHQGGMSGVTVFGQRDATPGVPTSSRGRGRYTNQGTPRGRLIRSITTRTHDDQRNPDPGTPRRRRVRRHHSRH